MKLMLKGDRCFLEKCAFERRAYAPGEHGIMSKRKKVGSDYAEQLREKQKTKRIYGIEERQFRKIFSLAQRKTGVTGTTFLQLLECRLDNLVFRMGFAPSRNTARQLVAHGHFLVNGKGVNIPSFILKANDVIAADEKSKKVEAIQAALKSGKRGEAPDWIRVDKVKLEGQVMAIPTRDQIATPINEQLIVELYSK